MTITERLRQEISWTICSDEQKQLLVDAKAAIERLQTALEKAAVLLPQAPYNALSTIQKALKTDAD